MTTRSLAVAQVQAAGLEGLDDLLDRLATEVRDRRQLRLGLLQQFADRLDARALQAVVRADARLELLDQDVAHRTAAATARGYAGTGETARSARSVAARGLELLEAIGIGED